VLIKTCGTRFSERGVNDRQRRRLSEGHWRTDFGLSLTGFCLLPTCSAALEGTVKLYFENLRRLGVSLLQGGVLRRVRMYAELALVCAVYRGVEGGLVTNAC